MDNYAGEFIVKKVILKIVAMVLWAATALIAGYEIFLARHIVSTYYMRYLDRISIPVNVLERLSATGIGNIAAFIMAVIAIVIVVGGWDYHWSHGGEKRSFILLGITIVFQMIVLGLYVTL